MSRSLGNSMSYCAHLYIHLYIYFSHLHVNIFRLSHSQTPCINLFEVAKYAVYLNLKAWFIHKISYMPSRFFRSAYICSIYLYLFMYIGSKYFASILSYLIIINWNNKWPNVQHVFISPLPSQLRSCDIEKFLVLSSIHATLY